MASSHGPAGGITVATTSPKSANGEAAVTLNSSSPKGQCLCSPTTHQGSFRCRFHRSNSAAAYFKRSKSMPVHHPNMPSLSPKSVDST